MPVLEGSCDCPGCDIKYAWDRGMLEFVWSFGSGVYTLEESNFQKFDKVPLTSCEIEEVQTSMQDLEGRFESDWKLGLFPKWINGKPHWA